MLAIRFGIFTSAVFQEMKFCEKSYISNCNCDDSKCDSFPLPKMVKDSKRLEGSSKATIYFWLFELTVQECNKVYNNINCFVRCHVITVQLDLNLNNVFPLFLPSVREKICIECKVDEASEFYDKITPKGL